MERARFYSLALFVLYLVPIFAIKHMSYNNNILRRIAGALFPLLAVLLFTQCFHVKPGTQKGGKSLYETFFVGDQGVQYFIKPIAFSNEQNNKLVADITFRHKKEVKDSAIINFTLLHPNPVKQIDSLEIKNGSYKFTAKNVTLLFVERDGKEYNSRHSLKTSLLNVKNIFADKSWVITVYAPGNTSIYTSGNSTQKKIGLLNLDVFSLL